jgi:uncharacterized protein YoxC
MNIMKTFKDISRLPEYIQNIWADVRDLSIAASNANSKSSRSHNEMIEKIDLLNKSYQELFRICCSRFNAIDIALEAIKGKMIVINDDIVNDVYKEHGQSQLKNILRDHFDNISFDLRDHDIVCTSEDAINSVQNDVEELTSQVQDIVNTMNDGFNELKLAIEERNWTIQPGQTLTITAAEKE